MAFKFREQLAQKKKSLFSCCVFMGLLLTEIGNRSQRCEMFPGVSEPFILVKAYLGQNYYLCRLNKNKNAK